MEKTATTKTRRFFIGSHQIDAPIIDTGLYLVATPIGNLEDISIRALRCLAGVDIIYCEDTRNTSRLLDRYGIKTITKSYHDHNGAKIRPVILDQLAAGKSIALVSDAGTPLVNDPGFKLVREAISQNSHVDLIPGPSAPIMALALSGLPSDRFMFAGFLPQKEKARHDLLLELAKIQSTLIFFETANRIEASLKDIESLLPNRQIAIGRELTKLHQETLRGSPSEILDIIISRGMLKGEITLVIEPPHESEIDINSETIITRMKILLENLSVKEVSVKLAEETGLPRRDLYQMALAIKQGRNE